MLFSPDPYFSRVVLILFGKEKTTAMSVSDRFCHIKNRLDVADFCRTFLTAWVISSVFAVLFAVLLTAK